LLFQLIADDKLTESDTTKRDEADPNQRDHSIEADPNQRDHSISNENHDEEVYIMKTNDEDIDIMRKSSSYQQNASDTDSDLVRHHGRHCYTMYDGDLFS